jgi:hypothetical protein
MMRSSQCRSCIHLDTPIQGNTPTCAAFPNGMPSGVFMGYIDHRQPIDGDNDIQFKQDPDQPLYWQG